MSQHDLDIANQGFPATRADLNLALKALGSSNSGASAPSTTYANQLWYDTANNILKIRNEDNDAWISLLTLDQSADNIEALTVNGTVTVDQLDSDNIRIDGNTISSTDTNGNVNIDPAGTGDLIVASGNVGIGTSSPSKPLHVSLPTGSGATPRATAVAVIDGNDNTQLDILGGTGSILGINFGDSSDNDQARITCNTTSGSENMAFTVNAAERMRISSDGEITKPSQPAFMAQPSSTQSNLAGDTNVDVLMGTEQYDVGSNFSSSTFTAPVTGKYFLSFTLYGTELAGAANYMEMSIDTSNRNYTTIQEPSGTETVFAGGTIAAIADMDANDTAKCRITIGGSSTFDVTVSSRFTGALVC